MGKYSIIFFLEWVLVNIGHIGNAESSVLFLPRGSDLNLLKRDTHPGAVQESGDEGNYFIMGPSNLLEYYKPLMCILLSDTRHFMFYKLTKLTRTIPFWAVSRLKTVSGSFGACLNYFLFFISSHLPVNLLLCPPSFRLNPCWYMHSLNCSA